MKSSSPRRVGAKGRIRAVAAAGVGLCLAVTCMVGVPAPAGAANPAPTPTPARVGRPTTIAALGDSITQATGTGQLGKENPKNSWSTGSDIQSVRARLGISNANAQNLAANGARMSHAQSQVSTGRDGAALKPGTQYVTIEMGGNDLCRDSVGDMTPTATFRTQLRAALAAIKTRAPEALVFVMSVPDIYNLWYIRGGPQNGTYHPEPQSDQASGLNGARFYWDGLTGVGVKFPCQSLLSNPDSYSQGDRDRRAAVRQRTLDYNAALRAECGQWLRCRYDNDHLFSLTSNRVNPPHGPLLAHSQWRFTDQDISRNSGAGRYLCPVQGVVAGGCGDHFHPSLNGQLKLAQAATDSSYQWSDVTAPTVGVAASPAARPDGTYRGPVTVTFSGTDAAGLRGQEVRVHQPNGTVSAWSESIGVHPALQLTQVGVHHVEARSLDVNGNLSASRVLTVDIQHRAPAAPGTPTAVAGKGNAAVTWTATPDNGGTAVTGHRVEVTDPAGATPAVSTHGTGLSATPVVPNGRVATFRVSAVNAVGASAWSPRSQPVLPPFASPDAYVARLYDDMALRAPTAGETASARDVLVSGAQIPADVAEQLLANPQWEPVLAPIVRLYRAYFLRFPESGGLAYWESRARAGMGINAMSQAFSGTPEFRTMYGSLDDEAFVRLVYRNVLEREAEPAGLEYWMGELASRRYTRGRMMTFYSESIENRNLTRHRVTPILLWWGLLDRTPTTSERTQAITVLTGSGTPADLAETIFATQEWADHVRP